MDYVLLALSVFSALGVVYLLCREKKVFKIEVSNEEEKTSNTLDGIAGVLGKFFESQINRISSFANKENTILARFIQKLKFNFQRTIRSVQGKVPSTNKGTASVFLRDLAPEKRKVE